jgi:hypothetical protein
MPPDSRTLPGVRWSSAPFAGHVAPESLCSCTCSAPAGCRPGSSRPARAARARRARGKQHRAAVREASAPRRAQLPAPVVVGAEVMTNFTWSAASQACELVVEVATPRRTIGVFTSTTRDHARVDTVVAERTAGLELTPRARCHTAAPAARGPFCASGSPPGDADMAGTERGDLRPDLHRGSTTRRRGRRRRCRNSGSAAGSR